MTETTAEVTEADVLAVARRAREAATGLAALTRDSKDAALLAMADALEAATDRVVAVNIEDLDRARSADMHASHGGRPRGYACSTSIVSVSLPINQSINKQIVHPSRNFRFFPTDHDAPLQMATTALVAVEPCFE